MPVEKPQTLRELYQMILEDNPAFLDARLSFLVRDQHLNTESTTLPTSLWDCPRAIHPESQGGAYLNIIVHLNDRSALRKRAKR